MHLSIYQSQSLSVSLSLVGRLYSQTSRPQVFARRRRPVSTPTVQPCRVLSAACWYNTGWVKKYKLLILSEYVNKTEKTGGTWTNTNSYRENETLSDIFTWNILRHNKCFMFKYSTTVLITQRSTRPLCIYDVIKVCSIEYLTTE